MDTFDNFQYESASSYGGALSVVDDNSSVYTANTQSHSTLDLESLSVSRFLLRPVPMVMPDISISITKVEPQWTMPF
jgi:hypothetical protein